MVVKLTKMNKIFIEYFETKFGEFILGSFQEKICLCDWRYRKMRNTIDNRILKGLNAEFIKQETEIIKETKAELLEYFSETRTQFSIPLILVGTDFQKTVWNELLKIPYGKTESYLGLSIKLNNKKAIRAVASANGANAISILIPCHRIIGNTGELVGYAGGISTKKRLLELENKLFQTKINFFE